MKMERSLEAKLDLFVKVMLNKKVYTFKKYLHQ